MNKYEEMSDFEINKLVAIREHLIINDCQPMAKRVIGSEVRVNDIVGSWFFDPCNNPSDAWHIIVSNEITICPDVYIGGWYGQKDIDRGMDGDSIHVTKDKNPLRAAMICFLKMKGTEGSQ